MQENHLRESYGLFFLKLSESSQRQEHLRVFGENFSVCYSVSQTGV
jgi:hypothetical protein